MRRVWLTAKYEMRSHLSRRSFWVTTFVLPAALVALVLLIHAFSGGSGDQTGLPGLAGDSGAIGYVDEGGLLKTSVASLPSGLAYKYSSEQEARNALQQGRIDRFYLVPADYVSSGRLTVVQQRYQPLKAVSSGQLMTYLLNTGISGDESLARLLLDPTPVVQTSALAPADIGSPDSAAVSYLLPYLLMFILYLALAMTSGFMLQSVSREKENRTAEMLLVSMRPRDLMLGKIAGLSVVGLLQVAIWMAFFFGIGGGFGSVIGIDLHVTAGAAARIIPWTVGYFLFGYLMYAAIYATLGVLTPTVRDANHFVYIAIIPLVIPLLFNAVISQDPGGALAVTLSLFPLTSPIAMVARQGAALVPWWQALAGLVVLAAFAYLFVLTAGKLFRAENVLSARALTLTRLKAELRLPGGGGQTTMRAEQPADTPETKATMAPSKRTAPWVGRGAQVSNKRFYATIGIAVVVLAIGLVEYLVQGNKSGLIISIVGVVTGASAFARRRKS
jgi:ABC-2 type transport system permease protein